MNNRLNSTLSNPKTTDPFFITTAIYYLNEPPHLGHAYEMLAADITARYFRRLGRDVFFLTGSDEHGQKVALAAKKQQLSPGEFVDQMALRYQATWSALGIQYDNFIRTTAPDHQKYVQDFLNRLFELGYIYQDRYQGLYCVGCEEYKLQKELLEGDICPLHHAKCQSVYENVYFFRLSQFEKQILDIIQSEKIKIDPPERKNEILGFLKNEPLKDLAISRTNVSWGIPVPWDKSQTIYVWVDALLNYLTGGQGHWPPSLQIIGKDIYRFHTIIWPAMLLALGLELPQKIFIHGFLTIDGEKLSKSRGNIIDPLEIVKIYGVDPLRYFLFREIPFGEDGDFSLDRFEKRYHDDLANDLGNLVQRVIIMANKYQVSWQYRTIIKSFKQIDLAIERLNFDAALNFIWQMITEANQKIALEKPWELKDKNPQKLNEVIVQMMNTLSQIAYQIEPFLPETAWSIVDQLKSRKPYQLFPRKK